MKVMHSKLTNKFKNSDEQYAAVRPSYRLASTSEATFDRYGQKIMDQLDILQK